MKNKKILITGGTGSLGSYLAKKHCEDNLIVIFSRDERKQQELQQSIGCPNIKFVIGDIRDITSIDRALKEHKIDTVIHTAAMKHVSVCEQHPWECVQTNLIGTQNVLQSSINNHVDTFIALSTDKASDPYNTYGYSKLLMEQMVCSVKIPGKKFVCIRPGNLMGSSGSVLHIFKKQLDNKQKITVTNPDMTRFFITIGDIADYITQILETEASTGKVYIPIMKSIKMQDLVDVVIKRNCGASKTELHDHYEIVGSRLGEKIHECGVSRNESRKVINTFMDGLMVKSEENVIFDVKEFEIMSNTCERYSQEEINELLDKTNNEQGVKIV